METREFTGRTVKEALDQAVLIYGVPREELEYEVVSEGRGGVFGIGAEEAKVRVVVPNDEDFEEISDEEIVDATRETVETLVRLMQLDAEVTVAATTTVTEEDNSEFTVEISGPDLGLLIGRRGDTLSALQYLVNLIIAKRVGAPVRIAVDVEGYKKRRAQSLRSLALRMAERAQQYRQPVTLEAMPPNERRLIHLALRNHPTVTSQSIGEGDDRKVVISPKR